MINDMLFYAAAFLTCGWGIAHLFPTRSVVKGFGEISQDNRHIITMEWIVEGVALIFTGLLIAVVTWTDRTHIISEAVLWMCIIHLNVLSVVSLFTGFKINFLPFKLCPLIFTGSSVIIVIGIYI